MKAWRKSVLMLMAAVAVAAAAVSLWIVSGSDDAPMASSAPTSSQFVQNDDDWIALIETARKVRAGEIPAASQPVQVPPGALVVPPCTPLPANFHISSVVNAAGPTPGSGRTELHYRDSEHGAQPLLRVVDWQVPLDECPSLLRSFVEEGRASRVTIDTHICDQMRIASRGEKMTDITLRQPSARVADAYLAAFCVGGDAPPTATPTPPR